MCWGPQPCCIPWTCCFVRSRGIWHQRKDSQLRFYTLSSKLRLQSVLWSGLQGWSPCSLNRHFSLPYTVSLWQRSSAVPQSCSCVCTDPISLLPLVNSAIFLTRALRLLFLNIQQCSCSDRNSPTLPTHPGFFPLLDKTDWMGAQLMLNLCEVSFPDIQHPEQWGTESILETSPLSCTKKTCCSVFSTWNMAHVMCVIGIFVMLVCVSITCAVFAPFPPALESYKTDVFEKLSSKATVHIATLLLQVNTREPNMVLHLLIVLSWIPTANLPC